MVFCYFFSYSCPTPQLVPVRSDRVGFITILIVPLCFDWLSKSRAVLFLFAVWKHISVLLYIRLPGALLTRGLWEPDDSTCWKSVRSCRGTRVGRLNKMRRQAWRQLQDLRVKAKQKVSQHQRSSDRILSSPIVFFFPIITTSV